MGIAFGQQTSPPNTRARLLTSYLGTCCTTTSASRFDCSYLSPSSALSCGLGYFVVAPTLLGHGFRTGTDFRLATLAEDLQPFLAETDYDVVIGHSMGGAITTILLSSLTRFRPISVILVDPALELPPEFIQAIKEERANDVANVKSVEAYMAEYPTWTRADAITRVFGLQACASPDVVREILGVSFFNLQSWCALTVRRSEKFSMVVCTPAPKGAR